MLIWIPMWFLQQGSIYCENLGCNWSWVLGRMQIDTSKQVSFCNKLQEMAWKRDTSATDSSFEEEGTQLG